MSSDSPREPETKSSVVTALLPIMAAVTGFGYSLVYPGFGVEAVRRAPAESRGLAMGAYTAFLDLALGLANPLLGLFAGAFGLSAVFLASALVVTCSAAVAARLLKRRVGHASGLEVLTS